MPISTGIDIVNSITRAYSLDLATRTASANGTAIDITASAEPLIAVVVRSLAASAGTNPTLDITVEHSLDNSNWVAVDAAAIVDPSSGTNDAATFTQVTDAAASLQVLGLRKQLLYRYIRVVATIGGTSTPTFLCSALIEYPKLETNS